MEVETAVDAGEIVAATAVAVTVADAAVIAAGEASIKSTSIQKRTKVTSSVLILDTNLPVDFYDK
jgi:hypothetical protein